MILRFLEAVASLPGGEGAQARGKAREDRMDVGDRRRVVRAAAGVDSVLEVVTCRSWLFTVVNCYCIYVWYLYTSRS